MLSFGCFVNSSPINLILLDSLRLQVLFINTGILYTELNFTWVCLQRLGYIVMMKFMQLVAYCLFMLNAMNAEIFGSLHI